MSVAALAKKLGGKRVLGREVRSESDLIEVVRAGLPALALDSVLKEFAALVGIQPLIYSAVGKRRTLQRKRTMASALSIDESDRLARLARLLVRAEEASATQTRRTAGW